MLARCAVLWCARPAGQGALGLNAMAAMGGAAVAKSAYAHMRQKKKMKKKVRFNAVKELVALRRGDEKGPAPPPGARGGLLCALGAEVFGKRERRNTRWEGTAGNVLYTPEGAPEALPEVVFISRRDVGRTRLLYRLLPTQEVRKASDTPSIMNFYNVADTFRIIDTPGYGWTKEPAAVQHRWQNTVLSLVRHRPNVKHVYLFTDARAPPCLTERDTSMMEFLSVHGIPFTHVITASDKVITKPYVTALKDMGVEERYESMLRCIHQAKKDTETERVPTLVTSAKEGKGIGALMYDMVHRVTAHRPVEDLNVDALRCQYPAPAPGALPHGGVDDDDDDEFAAMITAPEVLPPVGLSHGTFYSPAPILLEGGKKLRPRREKTSFNMLTEEEVANKDARHPLAGTKELRKYFPTLAETYLMQNNAEVNTAAKAKAEAHFGMSLPMRLKMKYATPEEKEQWRKLLNKA
eukprot:TRINITY_DN30550_c0_g1_i1.p1 TRINITY_DN30550_c0_g1~~TRINITY_DN30550_c0_g1_i1.p1  ORF type:complete len:465 (+),score=167.31 TRINITY_DN30550_c0_g1_i1:91-1485(+)